MSQEHCVIIGNGPAANAAATALRENTPDLDVTIIGEESFPHYRPHLLPDYVAGKLRKEDLYVTPTSYYESCNIKVRLGQKVVGVDFDRRELVLSHKEIMSFDALIITCGARQRIPEKLQVFQDLFLTLKTPHDAGRWVARLKSTDSVLIVGGDLTSLAFAKALASMDKKVLFLLEEESFWPIPLSNDVADQVKHRLSEKGIKIVDASCITRLAQRSHDSIEVETDRDPCRVGAVGAFFGLVPNVKFLVRSGLDIERGILVDEYLRTRFDLVYAAGDCAQIYHPGIRDYWVSIGYRNAIEQGKIAANNLLGGVCAVEISPASIFFAEGMMVNTSWWLEF